MALRCPTCGRFVSANYACTNCGSKEKIPVVYKNQSSAGTSSSSRGSSSRSLNNYLGISSPISFATTSNFDDFFSSPIERNSSTMYHQDLSSIRETVASLNDKINLFQRQLNDLKSQTHSVASVKEELIRSQNNQKVEVDQKVQQILSEEKAERKREFATLRENLESLLQSNRLTDIFRHQERFDELNTSKDAILKRCALLEKSIEDLKENYIYKVLRTEVDDLNGNNSVLEKRYESLEKNLKYEKAERVKLEAKLSELEKNKEIFMERCITLERKWKNDETAGQASHLSILRKLSELEANKSKSERQERYRDIIIIVLVLIICWILYPSFVMKVNDTSLGKYTFGKDKQLEYS